MWVVRKGRGDEFDYRRGDFVRQPIECSAGRR